MFHVVMIPGLGVDERIFQNLAVDDRFTRTIIRWIQPKPNENLTHYASRLTKQIPQQKNLILIGISFGGIIAVELAKLLNPLQTIIISSVKTRHELPWYYRLAGKLRLPYLVPLRAGKKLPKLQAYIFGAKTKEEATLLHQIIQELDIPYVRWALYQISTWPNQINIPNLLHVHGSHDKLFPIRYIHNFKAINGGEHLMVLSLGEQVSQIINQELLKLTESTA
ncbi:MAG: alpha/beta hydrolase [Adhaeribacter sp.]